MKIKRFDFWGYIFYPSMLNPFCWLALVLFILYTLFLCWWETKKDGNYTVYFIKERPFREGFKLIFLGAAAMFINTLWWNKGLAHSYARYLEEVWFPYYPKDDWRRAKNTRDTYHWYLNKRLICFKNIKRQIYLLEFRKEANGEWYVNLPSYKGDKADLQMVAGADTLLDLLADEKDIIYLKVSNKRFKKSLATLIKSDKISESGAFYTVENMKLSLFMKVIWTPDPTEIWLCDVLAYVFKSFPKKIYFKKM
jgi:hypothetical protein